MSAETDQLNSFGQLVLTNATALETLTPARDALTQTIDGLNKVTRSRFEFESHNPQSLTGDRRYDAAIAYAALVGENWYQVLPSLYQSIQETEKRVRNWQTGGLMMLDVSGTSGLGNILGRLIIGNVIDPRFKMDFEFCDPEVGVGEDRNSGGIRRWVPRMQLTTFTPRPEQHEFRSSTFRENYHWGEGILEIGSLFKPLYLREGRYESATERLKTGLLLGKDEIIIHLSDRIKNHGGYLACSQDRNLAYLTRASNAVGIEWIKDT